MTGLEVADVMALAEADSGGHLAASTGPDQEKYRPLRGPKATFPASIIRSMNVSGSGLCTAGR
jgi:hypothetical protein